jgi:hypothetical protein
MIKPVKEEFPHGDGFPIKIVHKDGKDLKDVKDLLLSVRITRSKVHYP